MERLVVLGPGDVITREDALRALSGNGGGAAHAPAAGATLRETLDRTEAEAVRQALVMHGSTRAAAKSLGVNQSTVVRKARRLGIVRD